MNPPRHDGPRLRISRDRILLGEGIEEVRTFSRILGELGRDDVQVEHYGGKTNLKAFLRALPVLPGFDRLKTIAVTRDADNSASSAFQSVTDAISAADLVAPSASGEFSQSEPRTGIFILPGSANSGMLEDLLLLAVQQDPRMHCVEELMQCVSGSVGTDVQPKPPAKARLSAWLAIQQKPGLRIGEAVETGYIPPNSMALASLHQFFKAL